ncbi:hypothetical protein RFI_35115, partial [Reticulomyxa filosa]
KEVKSTLKQLDKDHKKCIHLDKTLDNEIKTAQTDKEKFEQKDKKIDELKEKVDKRVKNADEKLENKGKEKLSLGGKLQKAFMPHDGKSGLFNPLKLVVGIVAVATTLVAEAVKQTTKLIGKGCEKLGEVMGKPLTAALEKISLIPWSS